MDKIIESINRKFNQKYDFLKLYEVTYDTSSMECVVTFLYPHTIQDIVDTNRKEIFEFLSGNIKINGKLKVKFKKSFLDDKLVKKEILDFISANFKAISVYIKENQIDIKNENDIIKISFYLGEEIKRYFDLSNVSTKLNEFLNEKFISSFEINSYIDEKFAVSDEIGEVEIPVLFNRNRRYQVYTVHPLFGGDIAPSPEFINDNKEQKIGVILAGIVSQKEKKTFTRKKGKRTGEEGTYYSFILDDGKKIECIYFSRKSNISKMDFITDGMTILCLGDIKMGLGDKLTYYIKKVAVATIDEESKQQKTQNLPQKHIPVVLPEDFITLKQTDIFTKQPVYNEYIRNNNFVVYDLETTGIDTSNDKIIEIGAVKIENCKVTKKFSTFINPGIHIPDEASAVNNIFDDMVADAPKITDVIVDFLNFAENCVISGYNNINFDNKFINKVTKELNLPFENENIDVFNLVRQKQLRSKNYKLTSVAEFLGISLEGAHRAYNDAYATAQVLLKLNEVENN